MDWNKLTEEILKRVDTIAAKLGVASGELWKILVRQALIEGAWYVFLALFLGTISFFLLRYSLTIWLVKWESLKTEPSLYDSNKKEVPDRIIGLIVSGVIGGLGAGVASTISAYSAIMALGNPPYYALKTLLETVK